MLVLELDNFSTNLNLPSACGRLDELRSVNILDLWFPHLKNR